MTKKEFMDLEPGDKVICRIDEQSTQFTDGFIYIVRIKPESNHDSVTVTLDDMGSSTNGWGYRFFEPYDSIDTTDLYKTLGMEVQDDQ